jgi:hypothetical protein
MKQVVNRSHYTRPTAASKMQNSCIIFVILPQSDHGIGIGLSGTPAPGSGTVRWTNLLGNL